MRIVIISPVAVVAVVAVLVRCIISWRASITSLPFSRTRRQTMVSAYTLLALSLAALTAPAYAQSSGSSAADAAQSLSTSCQATIAGLFVGGGDFAQCANARGLLSVVQSSETTELTSNSASSCCSLAAS